jgi:hypothetical protein
MDKHLLTEIDSELLIAYCSVCQNLVKIKQSRVNKVSGKPYWVCYNRHRDTKNRSERPHRLHKKDICEECGFVPKHPCQLAVDHIDGDKKNNTPENYQTLCHNCHAYKTHLRKDYMPKMWLKEPL